MKVLIVSTNLALSAVLFCVPAMAHHNSPDPDAIADQMPEEALDTHNEAVGDVLDRLEELGVSGAMDGAVLSNDMDPADTAQGNTCSVFDDDCEAGPGNVESPSEGMDRGPSITLPTP